LAVENSGTMISRSVDGLRLGKKNVTGLASPRLAGPSGRRSCRKTGEATKPADPVFEASPWPANGCWVFTVNSVKRWPWIAWALSGHTEKAKAVGYRRSKKLLACGDADAFAAPGGIHLPQGEGAVLSVERTGLPFLTILSRFGESPEHRRQYEGRRFCKIGA